MPLLSEVEAYQLHVYVRSISPMVWRRLLVRSDSTIADLHHTLQTVMEWHDAYLHHFLIRGKRYGIVRIGTWGFMDWADSVQLGQFNWRQNEKFFYEYNYYDEWQLVIRPDRCYVGRGAARAVQRHHGETAYSRSCRAAGRRSGS